jgi:hypothetical protein
MLTEMFLLQKELVKDSVNSVCVNCTALELSPRLMH